VSSTQWLPDTLDECTDFWRLHLWVRQHPGQWSLDQVYARMVELNEGPPTDDDLALSARLSDPWLKGIGFLRLAELHGDLSLDHDESYLTALIGLEPGLQLPLMRADRELREELVWGMLRQEGNRGVSLSASDRSATMGSERTPGWSRTFEASVNEGLVERDRLLDALLDMLAADLPSGRAGWYSRTLRLLAMTIDEAEARQSTLCALMSSPVGATVTLAVGHLSALARAGRLDLELFARSCEGALMGSKANARAALTILRGGLEVLSPGGIEPLLAIALSFPHAQVQALAIELASDALRSGLLDPAALGRLLSDAELDPLVADTISLLDPGHSASDQADPGLAPEEAPAAFLPPPREVVDLVPMSADDVVGRVGVLAQGAQMGLEYEALLAFLASPEFAPAVLESLRPLVRRLTTRRFGYERMLGRLLQIALDGGEEGAESPLAAGTAWLESENMPTLMRERIIEVAGLLARGQCYRLLATPTDDRGAVNPLTLVRRALDNGGATPLPADLTQALLRVDTEHPDCAAALALVEEREAELPAAARIRLALTGAVRRRAEGYLSSLSVTWEGRPYYESGKPKVARDGSPIYAFFFPRIVGVDTGATGHELSALADIASASGDFTAHRYLYPALVRHFAVCLLASQWYVLDSTQLTADCYRALCEHGGRWDSLSAQLLGQAMGEREVESRALGVETLASLVARGDLAFGEAVSAFAAVAHTVKLNRWAQAFQDLGDVDPRLALDLALALLPGLERGRTGIGQLLGVVTAQYARAQAEGWAPPLGEECIGWLALFRGSSQAAKYARTLKEMSQ
jgi:glycine hydroxymethyltransferase